MFKKITSKRDPDATVWKELHREFGGYFYSAGQSLGRLCTGHPKTIFGLMLALLLLSAVISFTTRRRPEPRSASIPALRETKRNGDKNHHPADDGFSRIVETGNALRQTLALKKEVETTLAKGRLSHADSLVLEHALDSLRQLQHQIHE